MYRCTISKRKFEVKMNFQVSAFRNILLIINNNNNNKLINKFLHRSVPKTLLSVPNLSQGIVLVHKVYFFPIMISITKIRVRVR